jgi:hypothetical protein
MVIDKLWLRIKGELLTLRDDLSEGENLRARAEHLLQKLDEQFRQAPTEPGPSSEANAEQDRGQSSPETPVEAGKADPRSIGEIEEEWRELVRLRNGTKARPSPSEPPSPNPRKLG